MWDYLNRNWFAGYLVTLGISSITIFFFVFHLILAIPVAKLVQPFAIFALITLPTTRGIYWAQPLAKRGNFGPLTLVCTLYFAGFSSMCVFFGAEFGFFEPSMKIRGYVLASAASLAAGGLVYVGGLFYRLSNENRSGKSGQDARR